MVFTLCALCCPEVVTAVGWVALLVLAVFGVLTVVDRIRRLSLRKKVKGSVVLVTGAGSGIGKQLTLDLLSRGAHVVLVDLRQSLLDAVVEEAGPACADRMSTYVMDVSDANAVASVCATIRSDLAPRHVSVLINNAGIVIGKPLLQLSVDQVRRTMDVNAVSHFLTTQQFLPDMVEKKDGVVVSMASVMGKGGAARLTEYCASKFAAVGFAESLRFELRAMGAKGVRSLTICPYMVTTGMFQGGLENSLLSFALPLLTANQVSSTTLNAIEGGEEVVIIPQRLAFLNALLRLVPVCVYDWIGVIAGATDGMEGFKGRGTDWAMASASKESKKTS